MRGMLLNVVHRQVQKANKNFLKNSDGLHNHSTLLSTHLMKIDKLSL